MIVVSNASPLLALAQADSLHALKALFGRVLIPAAVFRETVLTCSASRSSAGSLRRLPRSSRGCARLESICLSARDSVEAPTG